MRDAEYDREIESWRASLDAELRRQDGPLALVGLFWLQSGVNTVGSSRDCTFCLPKPAPRLIGAFDFDGQLLKFRADIGQLANVDGVAANPGIGVQIRVDTSPSRITIGEISMAPIQYGARLGIQVWDRSRPGLATLSPRRWFAVDDDLRVGATYTPYPAPAKVTVPDSLGGTHSGYAQGYVSFKLLGKSHNLDASEGDDGRLFLQFRDLTNGTQTFAEGRFLHTEMVSEDGGVTIDFNRAFNPLAAFTPFSPSAVAPKSHLLNCKVAAGERAPDFPPDWI